MKEFYDIFASLQSVMDNIKSPKKSAPANILASNSPKLSNSVPAKMETNDFCAQAGTPKLQCALLPELRAEPNKDQGFFVTEVFVGEEPVTAELRKQEICHSRLSLPSSSNKKDESSYTPPKSEE